MFILARETSVLGDFCVCFDIGDSSFFRVFKRARVYGVLLWV